MRLTLEVFVEGDCSVERLANVGRVLELRSDDTHTRLEAGRIEEIELVNGRIEVEAEIPDLAVVQSLVARWDDMDPFDTEQLSAVVSRLGLVRKAVRREIRIRDAQAGAAARMEARGL